MAKHKKKVLLIEPNYSNKFPPVGLMKIATYYRNLGDWEVVFYKGDLKTFIIEQIAEKLVQKLNEADYTITNWQFYKDKLVEYIRTRKTSSLENLPIDEENTLLLLPLINEAKDYYWKELWKLPKNREWDRIHITTLFTFYWDITVETIVFAANLAKKPENIQVGGVLASIQTEELKQELIRRLGKVGEKIDIHKGILRAGELDNKDTQHIDELELDYSILDEIDYQYPMSNAYYRYTTRGCVNKCPFCAVPTLEPDYQDYIPLKNRIEKVREKYGEQKDLLLMDNNVLASKQYDTIIQEIIDCGFAKGEKFFQPNLLEIAIRNLKNGVNDRAYIRKSWRLIDDFYNALKGEDSYAVYCIREKYHIEKFLTCTKENLIAAYDELKELYSKHHKPGLGKLRFVDFNQGLDARLFTQEKADLLGKIAIRPVRIAFDDIKTTEKYVEAIKMCQKAGIKDFSNYLLYNFNDEPDDLYNRLRVNVDLCEKLGVSIYSFPMKFHPIRKTNEMDEDFSHNRDYIGKHWNRKYIRAIQAVLNSTKGKIGRGTSFFEKAFGKDIDGYHKLLDMPETMIIYRFFFDWLGSEKGKAKSMEILGKDCYESSADAWWHTYQTCKETLPAEEWDKVLAYIHKNDFENYKDTFSNPIILKLLSYYINYRKAVIEEGTELYKLKQKYDENPTLEAKRHGKSQRLN